MGEPTKMYQVGAHLYFSVQSAALVLGVSANWVQKLIRSGRLPARRHGHVWLITAADLAALDRGKVGWPKGRKRKGEHTDGDTPGPRRDGIP